MKCEKIVLKNAIYHFMQLTVMPLICLLLPESSDIQLNFIYVEEKQQILTFKMLEQDSFWYFLLEK